MPQGSLAFQSRRSPVAGASAATEKLPPQNLDAERCVLGAILLDNEVLHDISTSLEADDFYRDSHQIVYKAILSMYGRSEAIDGITLADKLDRDGQFERIGGDEFLGEIANSVNHSANARYHADIVRQKAISRRLIQSATEIIGDCYANIHTAQEQLSVAEKKIFAISEREATGKTVEISVAVNEAMVQIQKAKDGECFGISTGYVDLDGYLLGMKSGQLIVLAGRPGTGKTTMACGITENVSEKQYSTLFVSLEMMRSELAMKMIASMAEIDSRRLLDTAKLSDVEFGRVAKAAAEVEKYRLRIDDTPGQSLLKISANARRWKARDNLSLLVIDYLGKIKEPGGRNENTVDILGRISGGLKDLAKELDIPILALHQLNRESEKEDREPRMSDLRGSGAIEQDADVIMLMHSRMPPGSPVGPVDLIIAKNRSGVTGRVNLTFNKPFNRLYSGALSGQVQEAEDQEPFHDH